MFGRPIGQNQGIQFPIARVYAQMRSAELIMYQAASLFERNEPTGFGFAEEFDNERKFREARLYQVAPISTGAAGGRFCP